VPDPVAPAGPDPESSPVELIPGLTQLAEVMADAVAVTDLHRRVVVWNGASERLYGIRADQALGVPIDGLYASHIVGEGVSSAGARALALEFGTWRGRVADRPLLGSATDRELVLDVVLSRIDDADGRPAGVLSAKRDVTASVRLEHDLATLGSLVTATGEARTRETLAERALELAMASTGAAHGLIAVRAGPSGRILATNRAPEVAVRLVTEIVWAESPAVRAVTPVGRVIKGPVVGLPLSASMRRALLEARTQTLLFVGLHREDELLGVLTLGWDRDDPNLPTDAAILLVATQISAGLENARLVEETMRRAEAERAMAASLRALDELTRVGGHVTTIEELVERSGRLINAALGAAGTAYGLLAPDGESYATASLVDVRAPIADWLRQNRPDDRSAFRRWRAGEGAFLEAFEPGVVPLEYVQMARAAGVTAYAAIPVRLDDVVVGGIAAYFDRPLDELHVDRGALDRVATITSISLANFRLRERLVGSERRYRTLFEESPDALVVTLPDGTVVDANEAALRMFRTEREWLLGRQPADLADYDVDDARLRQRAAGLAVGESFAGRAIGIRRDGDRFPEDVEVARVELDGEPRLLVRLRDLTEQERLQAELIQAQKMEATGQLVSGVAHELNNPLASILGFSQLIRRDPDLPEDLRHNADLLVEEASRTRRIVQNLLDFARQRPPERHPTSISVLIESVLALQSYSLGRGGIAVELDVPDDLPLVELDRGQVQQVLVNLTHNAVYAIRTGGGSRISISAAAEGSAARRRVRVTVMDDGPGVAPDHVGRLFEAFFTTKPPADGTGLGLPVSFGIIHSHGGELRYAPATWGRGAAFTFDLPIRGVSVDPAGLGGVASSEASPSDVPGGGQGAPAAATRRSDDAIGPGGAAPAGRPRVLVLDDEPSIRIFLEKALRVLGFEPVIAATADVAVERAGDGSYAALLIDHQMADRSGIEVYDGIVAANPDLARRYVLMSGDVLNPAIETFAASHRVGVLAKPFDLETLERVIRRLMATDGAATEVAPDQPRG
jgi:PAS domain S-box-containing protein